jgi:large subunit ribosomal protein L25
MTNLTLKVKKRIVFGKQNKLLREQGFIPAVLYGKKTPACSLQVDAQDFKDAYKVAGDTDIIDLIIEGGEKKQTKSVLIQKVSNHFLNGSFLHIDFFEVEMDKLITAHIPVNFTGESPAVKLGGVLVKPTSEIEVEALPMDIPHEIIVDISSLTDFDQTIYIKDIDFPAKVKVLIDENTPVVTVNAPITEEELEKELGGDKTVEEIEVEGEKKEGEEEEGGEVEKEKKEEENSGKDSSQKDSDKK